MVISDSLQLAFVHIPKCAGTTIRNALKQFDSYQLNGDFDHPDGGRRNLHHIPLAEIRTYFPEMYRKILLYESYAILREPRERFASGLLQYLRTRKGINLSRQSLALFQQAARSVCSYIEKSGEKPVLDLMFFQRQSRFVMLDGQQIIRNLYCFNELQHFADDLQARHGVVLNLSLPYNQAHLKNGPTLQLVKDFLRPIILRRLSPDKLRWMKARLRKATGSSPAELYSQLYTNDEISAFVDRYYSDDIALYRTVHLAHAVKRRPCTAAAIAGDGPRHNDNARSMNDD